MTKNSMLDDARESERKTVPKPRIDINFEQELPVALAVLHKELRITSAMRAYGYKSHASCTYRLMLVVREALDQGLIEVKKTNGRKT